MWTVVLKILDGMLITEGGRLRSTPGKCITFLKYEIVFMHPRCNSSTRTRGMWNTLSPRKKTFWRLNFLLVYIPKNFSREKIWKMSALEWQFLWRSYSSMDAKYNSNTIKFLNAASFKFSILPLSSKERYVQKHISSETKSKLLCIFRLFRNLSRLTIWLKINPLPQSSAYSSLCKCTCRWVREQSSRQSCYFLSSFVIWK